MWKNGTPPFWGAMEATFNSSEEWKILIKEAWDDLNDTSKKQFSYLEERSQK